ncbi:restriction endonuclease subunit S [Saccharopolyspora phatthalungensis]|uniref:Type I restriction enzyme S subunit n=1 Tax=Saccharopolyspora phatthalungensis TaxID=664693 RepID=A0A840Q169_9PSEU|nr:restriction endonuclease subunit S [Saccharopolyspora phatthalungensis]MBB5153710.1 type I restriction enzyme S subunit [Saccharopolyspora phatthalungensis]
MKEMRLRHLAQVNPSAPAFDRLSADEDVTFLPMESVWPGSGLDISQHRKKSSVASGYTRFQDGDVLVPKITPTFEAGRAVLVDGLCNGTGAGTTELHVLRAGAGLDSRFLLYCMSSYHFLKKGEAEMYGVAGQKRVPDEFIRDFPVVLFSLEEQRRIADFLDAETARIGRMVEVARRLRDVLHERLEAQNAWFLRGAHISGERSVHPVLGELPDAWRALSLRRVIPRIGVGVVVDPSSYFAEDGVPFIRGSNVRPGGFDLDGVRFISELDSKKLCRSRLSEGDVVVVRAGYPGRAAVVPSELDGANCASILVLKKGKFLRSKFLEYYFNGPLGETYVSSVRYGAAQEQINVSHVVDFMIPVPSLVEQDSILKELGGHSAAVSEMDGLLSRQIALLAERRQDLITAAVTGQIEVATASGRGIEG